MMLIRSQAGQHLLFPYCMLICGVVVGHDVCSCGVVDEWNNCCIHRHLSYRSILPHRQVHHMSNHMTPVHPFPAPCCFHILRGMSYPVSMTVPTVLID